MRSAETPRRRAALLTRRALIACVLIAAARAALFFVRPAQPTDFDQLWWAAGALLGGEDPYRVIAQGSSPYPLYYPLPAVLLAVPFSLVPLAMARVLWDIAVGWSLVLGLSRRPPFALLALGSGAYVHAMVRGQVTPLLVAAVLVPALGWLLSVKPNVGLALWAAFPLRRIAVQCGAAVLLSLAVWPAWPLTMWQALQVNSSHIRPPIALPFGWLLLAGALRWRTPEGRLLAALALIPQHLQPYETLVLCLVPRSAREMGIFVAGSWIALIPLIARPDAGPLDLQALGREVWPYLLVCVYLPALFLVLRRARLAPPGGLGTDSEAAAPPRVDPAGSRSYGE